MPRWKNIELKKIIESKLEIETIVRNESKVQALGEKYFGAAKKINNFMSVEAGVGVCGGIYYKNELIIGRNSKAGEIGHITLLENGPLCHCGNRGCWEVLISIDVLKESIRKKTGKILTTEEIVKYYENGSNEFINNKIEEIAKWFGIGFSSLLNIIDLELIIINGEYREFGDKFLEVIKDNIEKHVFPNMNINEYKIIYSNLGDKAEILGTFSMILDTIYSISLKNIKNTILF